MSRHVTIVSPTSALKLEQNAQARLREFQPEALAKPQAVDIEKYFEGRLPKIAKVTTNYEDLGRGILGCTDSVSKTVTIAPALVDSRDIVTLRRGRATIVHECGHALLHLPQFERRRDILRSIHDADHIRSAPRLYRQEEIPNYVNPEWQAWRWGRAFIMPAEQFVELHNSGASLREIGELFNVNISFVENRLYDLTKLGLIK